MKLKELIENEIGNAHDNPNIDNDVVADLMKEYAKLKCREQKDIIQGELYESYLPDERSFIALDAPEPEFD